MPELPRRIRIVSDGTGPGTRVLDAAGNELPLTRHLDSIVWRIGPRPENMPAVAVITLIDVEVELTGDLVADPEGVRRIRAS